ncbi:asparagine synthase-related protein [Flavisphingomonas formosensis]|uniref:asparagine synthase-related protein n=1 Tax=Flavisphingomonas formosensis TaxID=861534 RepID=UPI0012F93BCD|nr:asparagine synthase-related protein [Sphingomonas formosensis]
MGRLFGFFLRGNDAYGLRTRLEAVGRTRRGPPVYADERVLLWGDAAGAADDRAVPVIGWGTVHNRVELARALECGPTVLDDVALLRDAFARWGAAACERIQGDWCAAMWDASATSLLLARDRLGSSALYYHDGPDVFAFATAREDLMALDLAPAVLDELYVAQTLISWPAHHGSRTTDKSIARLPPAHWLRVTPDRLEIHYYWRLEDVWEAKLPRREDYVVRFRELFDEAVRIRVPASGAVATTLSSGLDSGSVAVTAAPFLASRGRRLPAYVSVPVHDPAPFMGATIGDEYPLAAVTARAAGTIDLRRIEAADASPVAAMREVLAITREPQHAAAAYYWMLDLLRTAARDGNEVLLIGQLGNGGISWSGDLTSLPLRHERSRHGLGGMARLRARRMLPWPVERLYRGLRMPRDFPTSAIHPEFARRMRLRERRLDDPVEGAYPTPRQERFRFIRPGSQKVGAVFAELGEATGITMADPTADPALLEFCFSVPDRIYVDPETGMRRWLIREAMKGRLPEEVRLNRMMGRQLSDLVPRLRRFPADMEDALDDVERGAGAAYVDVAWMRTVWQRLQSEEGSRILDLATTVLMRGLMAGLFVNGFGTRY